MMRRQSKYTGQHALGQIPDDLKAMGWEWVPSESHAVTTMGSTWYTAVYVRPFEQSIDREGVVTIVYQHDRRWVQVSTAGTHHLSWEAAHEDAIALMREADTTRREAE